MNTIIRFSAVTVKDLQVFFKDRLMVFTIFALPLIVSLIAGSPYLGGGEEVINLPMILVDLDPGRYSDDIVDILEDIDELDLTEMSSFEQATALVGEGSMLAAVYIPADFTQRVEDYEQAVITVVIDPAQAQYSSMITTIMEEVTEPVVIQGEMRHGTRAVMADVGLLDSDNPDEVAAADAQNEGSISKQMEEIRNNPKVEVRKEHYEKATVYDPPNVFSAFIPSFTVLFAFFVVPILSVELIREREEGTLRRLVSAPIGRGSIVVGKILAFLLVVILQVAIVFGVANLAFGMPLGDSPLGLLLVTLALGFTATALGLMLAGLAKSRSQANSLGLMVVFGVGVLGGCFPFGTVLLSRTEGFLGMLSKLTPQAHALEGFRIILVEGGGVVDVLPQVGVLLAMGIVFFLIARWRFKF
jgi:ABC-2 type transport system permease protein